MVEDKLSNLISRYPSLVVCKDDIWKSYKILEETFERKNKLLIAGNGGSSCDSEHIAGELMKSFVLHRPVSFEFRKKLMSVDREKGDALSKNLEQGFPVVTLSAHEAFTTAYINDVNSQSVFAQQLFVCGKIKDAFLGISTSGNSKNIIDAAITARAMEIKVIGLTGKSGGNLKTLSDVCIKVPETETYKIQELHLPIYHCLCLMLEERFFG